jgi:hypothetical protein
MSKKFVDKLGKNASSSQVIIERSDNDTTSSDSETSIAESNSNSGTETTESDSNHRETLISSSKQQLKASSRSAVENSNSDSTEELFKKLTEKVMDLTSKQQLSPGAKILESLSSCPEYVLPRSMDIQITSNQRIANPSPRERKTRGG